MSKKLLSLALALVLALSLMPSAFAAEIVSSDEKFTDVPANAWYLDELNYAVANGYISGTSDTSFSPDAQVSRGQFVTILGRMLNVDTTLYTSSKFDDVDPNSWYGPYVSWASDNGYVNGYSPSEFGPDNSITVEQMGVIISNYISKTGVELVGTSPAKAYTDASSISGWAVTSMETMRQYNLLVTDTAGNVNPTKQVTRAEGAVSLVRLAKATGLGEEPTIVSKPTGSMETPIDGTSHSEEAYAAAVSVHDDLWASGAITSSMSQKEKARVYYDWLIQHCEYDYEAYDYGQAHDGDAGPYATSLTRYGALVTGKAVCQGYTLAYNSLLLLEGIDCGVVTVPGIHDWTTASLDGVLYHIDATWGDTTGDPNKYFCMTEDAAWARFGGKEQWQPAFDFEQWLEELASGGGLYE